MPRGDGPASLSHRLVTTAAVQRPSWQRQPPPQDMVSRGQFAVHFGCAHSLYSSTETQVEGWQRHAGLQSASLEQETWDGLRRPSRVMDPLTMSTVLGSPSSSGRIVSGVRGLLEGPAVGVPGFVFFLEEGGGMAGPPGFEPQNPQLNPERLNLAQLGSFWRAVADGSPSETPGVEGFASCEDVSFDAGAAALSAIVRSVGSVGAGPLHCSLAATSTRRRAG